MFRVRLWLATCFEFDLDSQNVQDSILVINVPLAPLWFEKFSGLGSGSQFVSGCSLLVETLRFQIPNLCPHKFKTNPSKTLLLHTSFFFTLLFLICRLLVLHLLLLLLLCVKRRRIRLFARRCNNLICVLYFSAFSETNSM